MTAAPDIFLNNLLPIFLATGAGFLLGRTVPVEPRTLSRILFYVFSPSLVFNLLLESPLEAGEAFGVLGLFAVHLPLLALLTWGVGRILKLGRRLRIAMLLTTLFMNAGNFGLSLNLFAFGEASLAYASLIFVAMGALTYTAGVVIASSGELKIWPAIFNLRRIPTLYALGLGVVFLSMGWTVPLPVDRTIRLLAEGAIPGMLVLLGLQLQRSAWDGRRSALTAVALLRLVVSPLLALALSQLFGLTGLARQTGILDTGLPTAVSTTVLATEFDLEPVFVTSTVLLTTLLSPLTLTPLLAYLGA